MEITTEAIGKGRLFDTVFAASNLEHKHLAMERELQELRWLGYRFMTPLEATRHFFGVYRRRLVRYIEANKDVNLAKSIPDRSFEVFAKKPSNLTSAWVARQKADTTGVPYEVYISFGMDFWSSGKGPARSRYAPQINQLHFTDNSEAAWKAKFAKFGPDRADLDAEKLAAMPQFEVAAYRGTPEQKAAREFFLRVEASAPWDWRIKKWCYHYPVLPLSEFEAVMDADMFKSAMESLSYSMGPLPTPPVACGAVSALWPTCHGLPSAHDGTHETCAKCPFTKSCQQRALEVVNEVRLLHGTEEPRRQALREKPNARQASYRARQKAKAAEGCYMPSIL